MVENLPANAGDTGLSPGLGRSHMPRSDWARGPQLLSLHVWSLCSATREAAIMRGPRTVMKSGPHLPQLEKALAQKRRPNTAINLKKKKKKILIDEKPKASFDLMFLSSDHFIFLSCPSRQKFLFSISIFLFSIHLSFYANVVFYSVTPPKQFS